MPSDAAPGPDSDLRQRALEAELRLDFLAAFSHLVEAAAAERAFGMDDSGTRPDPVADAGNELLLFHAVRDLERSQSWRLIAALWEHIGDRLHGLVSGEGPARGLFDGMSLKSEFWRDPRPDDKPSGYYDRGPGGGRRERLAHTRALAYNHAAEEAAASNRFCAGHPSAPQGGARVGDERVG